MAKKKEIWEYDSYRTDRTLITNTVIMEYDLKSANTSVAREFKILPEEFVDSLDKLPKKDREVRMGLYKKDHKEYNEYEKAAFSLARKMFFEQNEIIENRIIAIKKDAIFVEGIVTVTQVAKHLLFRPKHEYTSFMWIKVPGRFPGLEIYYSHENGLDVKGISDDIYNSCHADGMGKFVGSVFRLLEFGNTGDTLKFIRNFFDQYKSKQLDVDFYREFNSESQYRYLDGVTSDRCIDLEQIDIGYNFNFILQVLMKLL